MDTHRLGEDPQHTEIHDKVDRWPTVKEIGRRHGVGPRQVRKILEHMGLLERQTPTSAPGSRISVFAVARAASIESVEYDLRAQPNRVTVGCPGGADRGRDSGSNQRDSVMPLIAIPAALGAQFPCWGVIQQPRCREPAAPGPSPRNHRRNAV